MLLLTKENHFRPYKTEIYRTVNRRFQRVYSAAHPIGKRIKLRFMIHNSCNSLSMIARIWDDAAESAEIFNCTHIGISDHGYDIYELILKLPKIGLYCLNTYYQSPEGEREFLFYDEQNYLPITVFSADYKTPDSFKGGTMYQIFVDRFAKSKNHVLPVKDYARINPDWENGIPDYAEIPGQPLDNAMFFGGSLYGVAEKLDYLSSLGVNILYLCPIFEARTNHKYDTSDYMKVDPMFGGEEALDALISECKKKGIKLILDGVFNHVGDDSIYFNKRGNFPSLGAYQSKKSKYYPWFDFEKFPDKYNCWWGIDILPCIKKDCKDFREFVTGNGGVISYYLKKGINGWRLDVADELSDEFLCSLRKTAQKEDPEALIIGEVWEDASDKIAYSARRHYFQGKQLDGVMNYPLRRAIIDYVTTGCADTLARTASSLYMHYPEQVSHVLMNSLGTHDTERILSILAGEGIENKSNPELAGYKMSDEARTTAIDQLKLASFLQFTLPGIPCIYYGDEAGMEGGRDPFNRLPFPWGCENATLIQHYTMLGGLRKNVVELIDGEFEVLISENGLLVYRRGDVICAVNKGEDTVLTFDSPVKDIIHGNASYERDGAYEISLAKNNYVILK